MDADLFYTKKQSIIQQISVVLDVLQCVAAAGPDGATADTQKDSWACAVPTRCTCAYELMSRAMSPTSAQHVAVHDRFEILKTAIASRPMRPHRQRPTSRFGTSKMSIAPTSMRPCLNLNSERTWILAHQEDAEFRPFTAIRIHHVERLWVARSDHPVEPSSHVHKLALKPIDHRQHAGPHRHRLYKVEDIAVDFGELPSRCVPSFPAVAKHGPRGFLEQELAFACRCFLTF